MEIKKTKELLDTKYSIYGMYYVKNALHYMIDVCKLH